MKIVIFSDVHGNLVALEKFLKLTRDIADTYICLGDVVNYGPWNDECLQLIYELPNVTMLMGNHEELFNGDINLKKEISLVRQFTQHSMLYFSRFDLIRGLPKHFDLNSYCCTHTIDGNSIYPDTELEIFRDFIIGHTHHQYRIERMGRTILNPGSVGQNRKWINAIDYLIYYEELNEFKFESVIYKVDLFISELRSRKYPKECIEYFLSKNRLPE